MICRHGNETCDECAKLLTVAEAADLVLRTPGMTHQEGAELCGRDRSVVSKAVTKRANAQNVTDPFDTPYYDVEWEGLNPSNDEVAAWVATWRSWRPASRLQAKSIIFNTPINSAP